MRVNVLLSVMNKKEPQEYIKTMNVFKNYVIINQLTNKDIVPINQKSSNKSIISLNDKGLSQSRNLAIKNCNAEIGIISDDDMFYVDNYEEIIINAYKKHPTADIIAFVVEHEDKLREKKILKEGRVNIFSTLKISSVQLTFKIESIKKKNIKFDENFGSGNKYYMGEENIFLIDCIKKRLNICYVPIKIGTLRVVNDSKWFEGYNEKYFKVKGAVFYRMSKFLYIMFILQFAIRKRKLYINNISLLSCIKYMFTGVLEYKEGLKNNLS